MNTKKTFSSNRTKRLVGVVLTAFLIYSCTKSANVAPPVNMSGNFDLISDSIHNQTQVLTIYSYKGQSGDYWNFRSDSLYIKEGPKMDTLFIVLNQDSLFIGGIPFRVSSEADGNVRLQNIKPEIDFGGNYDRIIILHSSSLE